MKNTIETRLGIFFALTAIVAVIVLEMAGVADYFKPGYKAYALFKTAQDLKEGDLVKMAGVEMGRVSRISLTNDMVCVTMKIKNTQAEIRTTSKAAIRFTGLMGQNFVALDFGTPDGFPARDGCTFTTYEQPDLGSLMAKLQDVASSVQGLAKGFTPENLAPLFGPITDFVKMNTNNLSAILGNIRTATDQLAQGKGSVGRLLNDDAALYNSALSAVAGVQAGAAELKPMLSQVRMTLDTVQSVVADIKEGHGTVGKLIKDESLFRETTDAMTNLRQILEKINRGQGTVGELVNTNTFLKNVKVSLQKLDKATEGLEDQGPISVIGLMAGQLF